MGINNSYDEEAIVKAIATALEEFYNSLIDKIDTIDIKKIMKRKNYKKEEEKLKEKILKFHIINLLMII